MELQMEYNKFKSLLGFFIVCNLGCIYSYALNNSTEAIQKRIQPVGQVNITKAITPRTIIPKQENALAKSDGKVIFENTCKTCHETGVAGAPKLGDAAAWKPRISKGMTTLFAHATRGFNAMPAKGGCTACSDADIMAAIKYMTQQSKH
jgi:cytochrome c5